MEPTKLTMKYNQLMAHEFNQLVSKIANTPTSAQKASLLRKAIKKLQDYKNFISAQYVERVVKSHFKCDEEGNPVKDEKGDYIALAESTDELDKANEAFGQTEIEVETVFRPSLLADVKGITAREMDLLGNLFTEEDGPGVPHGAFPPINPHAGERVNPLRQ